MSARKDSILKTQTTTQKIANHAPVSTVKVSEVGDVELRQAFAKLTILKGAKGSLNLFYIFFQGKSTQSSARNVPGEDPGSVTDVSR